LVHFTVILPQRITIERLLGQGWRVKPRKYRRDCLGILVNFLPAARPRQLEHDPVPTTLSAARDLTPAPALLI
jgi:hypothetical protein